MKKIIFTGIIAIFCFCVMNPAETFAADMWSSQTPVRVKAHYRSDGTFVQQHYRARPSKY